jgi:hypothetical protein
LSVAVAPVISSGRRRVVVRVMPTKEDLILLVTPVV